MDPGNGQTKKPLKKEKRHVPKKARRRRERRRHPTWHHTTGGGRKRLPIRETREKNPAKPERNPAPRHAREEPPEGVSLRSEENGALAIVEGAARRAPAWQDNLPLEPVGIYSCLAAGFRELLSGGKR
ncbi:hypothetical protein LSM04_004413 [Trypanosoma melophagium]|uniref:uncharacterized protein n=1 Tax=Trypanosoma melophagium TaxID=715481 RepID=UPI00351A238B|nr:hypothetical protein LSM04_004413 [Trypanosoma melophagium]